MILCSILIFLSYSCLATAQSVIFHKGRWEKCKFMQVRWDQPFYLRIFGDGFHLFNFIGQGLLFIAGFFFIFEVGYINLLILMAIAWITFTVFLHIIFK